MYLSRQEIYISLFAYASSFEKTNYLDTKAANG